ncbi:MAG: AbrB/MazE/SpoVT family DNA-binding domain-containing protein [Thermoguttaceae bacterium]
MGTARKAGARYKGKVNSAGRVLIPTPLRAKLGVQPGATVSSTEGCAGRIVLESRMAAVRQAQEYFCGATPPTEARSDRLTAERRKEARREIEDRAVERMLRLWISL